MPSPPTRWPVVRDVPAAGIASLRCRFAGRRSSTKATVGGHPVGPPRQLGLRSPYRVSGRPTCPYRRLRSATFVSARCSR